MSSIGNTLDIGLLDPAEFRGWSGSHKRHFTVAETWATSSYIAGRLPAGTWRLLLGAYKVAPQGCEYEVRIAFSSETGAPPQRSHRIDAQRANRASAAEPGWLRGDLHCHTLHSDGDSWPEDMLGEAVRHGLDFLRVTYHNTTTHHADYAQAVGAELPIILPGLPTTWTQVGTCPRLGYAWSARAGRVRRWRDAAPFECR